MGLWGRGRDNGLACSLKMCSKQWLPFCRCCFGPESSLASVESVELKLPGFESFPQPGHCCNTFEPWFLFAFHWNPFDFKGVKDDTETWAPIFDSPTHFSLCRITSPFTCYLLREWWQGLGKCLHLRVTQCSGLKHWSYYSLLLKMSLLAEIMHWPHYFLFNIGLSHDIKSLKYEKSAISPCGL